jgi:hypothetical protein
MFMSEIKVMFKKDVTLNHQQPNDALLLGLYCHLHNNLNNNPQYLQPNIQH